MLMPGAQMDSSGRLSFTIGSGGEAPAIVNQGVALKSTNRILADSAAPSGSLYRNAFRLNANGNIFTTTSTAATDTYANGYRFSNVGALVIEAEGTPAHFKAGEAFNASSALIVTGL